MDLPAILDDSFVSQKRYGTEGMKIILMESEGEREREEKKRRSRVDVRIPGAAAELWGRTKRA